MKTLHLPATHSISNLPQNKLYIHVSFVLFLDSNRSIFTHLCDVNRAKTGRETWIFQSIARVIFHLEVLHSNSNNKNFLREPVLRSGAIRYGKRTSSQFHPGRMGGILYKVLYREAYLFQNTILAEKSPLSDTLLKKGTHFTYFHNWPVLWINRQKRKCSFHFHVFFFFFNHNLQN